MAPLFVSWLRLPRGLHWLDVGCGTGACTEAILAHAEPASVTGCDPALPFVDFAREHHAKPHWMPAVANCWLKHCGSAYLRSPMEHLPSRRAPGQCAERRSQADGSFARVRETAVMMPMPAMMRHAMAM
jgi:SAM-dependent methyltransferase